MSVIIVLECPELPNIYAIIGGAIAAVALIGLVILLIIKGFLYWRDVKEFRRFENEKKKEKWTPVSDICYFIEIITLAQIHYSLFMRFSLDA